MVLAILKNKNDILRKKSSPLSEIKKEDIAILDNMLETMYQAKGIGLAAPQVGLLKQMVVIDIGNGPLRLINPKIVKRKGRRKISAEGCLSLPELSVSVKRYAEIEVEALDTEGNKVGLKAADLLSRVLQHEIDHLEGKLIIDYLPWFKRIPEKIRMGLQK